MFWNKNISEVEFWFIGIFLTIYIIYFIKVIYVSKKMKVSARASFLKFLPRVSALTLLIVALLEPTFGNFETFSKNKISNKVIYFIIDISKSMDATDIAPSRLEKTKNEIKKIVSYFTNERFGIITFASQSFLHSPLTTDLENLKVRLGTINTKITEESGTNLLEGLKLGLEKISKTNSFRQQAAAMVLFTDGEDFADLNINILNEFKRKRIKLLVVGIGTKKGSKIINDTGTELKSNNNEIIISKLQIEYLKTLAQKTNGTYYEYNASNSPLNDLITAIEGLQNSSSNITLNASNPGNKFHYPLIIAMVIICFDFMFTIRVFNF